MSSMKNLDLMIQGDNYEQYKELINQHFNGDLRSDELPQPLKDILFQWEIEEMELEPQDNYDIREWESAT